MRPASFVGYCGMFWRRGALPALYCLFFLESTLPFRVLYKLRYGMFRNLFYNSMIV